MKRTQAASAVIAAAIAAASLTACGGSAPDYYAACKQGIAADVTAGRTGADPPAACKHLTGAQLGRIAVTLSEEGAARILQRAGYGSASPTASASPSSAPAQVQRCTLVIEAKANAGTLPEIRNIRPHDPRLPDQCRPLGLNQLQTAVHQALTDLGG